MHRRLVIAAAVFAVVHFGFNSAASADFAPPAKDQTTANSARNAQTPVADWADDFATPGIVPQTGESNSGRREVIEIPPPPGSASLVLSAFASIGAVQLARSVRHAKIGQLPDWYHSGGVRQVRHIVALDLAYPALLPCVFASPTAFFPQVTLEWIGRSAEDLVIKHNQLISCARRGPPVCL